MCIWPVIHEYGHSLMKCPHCPELKQFPRVGFGWVPADADRLILRLFGGRAVLPWLCPVTGPLGTLLHLFSRLSSLDPIFSNAFFISSPMFLFAISDFPEALPLAGSLCLIEADDLVVCPGLAITVHFFPGGILATLPAGWSSSASSPDDDSVSSSYSCGLTIRVGLRLLLSWESVLLGFLLVSWNFTASYTAWSMLKGSLIYSIWNWAFSSTSPSINLRKRSSALVLGSRFGYAFSYSIFSSAA